MTTTEFSFFGQNGVARVYAADGTSASTDNLLALQNVSIELQFEGADLYGAGTVKRIDAARHEAKVNVTCEYARIIDESFIKYILDPSGAGTLATGVSIADTTNVHYFDVAISIPASGNTTGGASNRWLYVIAKQVYFKNLPISASIGEWVKLNLEGSGADMTVSLVTADPFSV